MPKTRRKVNIIGHRNPDTDSICSALAYTYLKNQLGDAVYEARRAGQINRETAFVLKHFGVEPPRLCTDVSPQVKDIDIREQPGIDKEMSIRAAWSMMRDTEIDTLCAIDEDKELLGLITVKDIANANMDLFDTEVLAKSKTSYKNVLSTLEGEMLLGDPDACITSGRIFIGTSPEIMDGAVNPGDIVLVSNRYEVQMCAIDCGAGAIVVCCGSAVPRTILARAQEKGCIVITTPFDTYAAARLISTAAPVRHFMRSKNLLEFSVNTAVEDARKVMADALAMPGNESKQGVLATPKAWNTPYFVLLKVSLVAWLAFVLGVLTPVNGAIWALVCGVVFCRLGFLEPDVLSHTGSKDFLFLALIMFVYSGLADCTPSMLFDLIGPMLTLIVVGLIGMGIVAAIVGRILRISPYLGFANCLTALYGFPFDAIMTEKICNDEGATKDEVDYLMSRLFPSMIVGGFITVTITSVLLAGFFVKLL